MPGSSSQETLILVDSEDRRIGSAAKADCHRRPLRLHRAFSVFLFDRDGRMLITKRSAKKDTWPGFWSNACCSHPHDEESTEEAARRRLREELGISAELGFLFTFEYRADYDATWGEHELDHVFVGQYDGPLDPDRDEVDEAKFIDVADLKQDVRDRPERYTPWFKISLDRVLDSRCAGGSPPTRG
jgi:isopentenyl-diphosphate delta-isomerase